MRLFYLQLLLLILLSNVLKAQQQICGTIKDNKTNETLPGSLIVIKGTGYNTVSDINGKFRLNTDHTYPITISVVYLGYTSKEIAIESAEPVVIKLSAEPVKMKDVNISGSRITERQKQAPLTLETLDRIGISEIPTPDFYEGLGALKGVDDQYPWL